MNANSLSKFQIIFVKEKLCVETRLKVNKPDELDKLYQILMFSCIKMRISQLIPSIEWDTKFFDCSLRNYLQTSFSLRYLPILLVHVYLSEKKREKIEINFLENDHFDEVLRYG